MAETQEGVDWKALSHAVRVGTQALELLKTGHVTFPLPNAAHVVRHQDRKASVSAGCGRNRRFLPVNNPNI
jgi:hypothetical protein